MATVTKPMPRPKNPEPRDRIDLRVAPEWVERVRQHAERMGVSISAYIRMATSERMDRDDAAANAGGRKGA